MGAHPQRCLAARVVKKRLNPWGYKLEHAMAVGWNLLGGRRDRVRNVPHGTRLGHPLHPGLTLFGAIRPRVAIR